MYDEDALRRLVGKKGIAYAIAHLTNMAKDDILNTDLSKNGIVLLDGRPNIALIYSLA